MQRSVLILNYSKQHLSFRIPANTHNYKQLNFRFIERSYVIFAKRQHGGSRCAADYEISDSHCTHCTHIAGASCLTVTGYDAKPRVGHRDQARKSCASWWGVQRSGTGRVTGQEQTGTKRSLDRTKKKDRQKNNAIQIFETNRT